MARKIVAGNWKMNMLADEAKELFDDVNGRAGEASCELIVCPPALYVQNFASIKGSLKIGAQNVSQYEKGAYTGEWSSDMLKSISADYCIVGHSERRSLFSETDEEVNIKVKLLLNSGVNPILCCGETLDQRECGSEKDVVKDQLLKGLEGVSSDKVINVVVAYEPVWAIGTGVTATSDQAQEMHAFIRSVLNEKYGEVSSDVSLLYGGSCKPTNAVELFACKDIDGGLIGGASLDVESFLAIAKSFS